MSNKFDVSNLDYIDDRSRDIINGYIRNAQKLLKSSSFKYIPIEINAITLCFIDDHFMIHRGSYQWKITDPTQLQNILSSQPDEYFRSDVFDMSHLKWSILLYPNGNSSVNVAQGHVGLFASLLSMPSTWGAFVCLQSLICHETNTAFHCIQVYESLSC